VSVAVGLSIVGLGAISLLLALVLLGRFRRDRRAWHLYWGIGILLVAVTLAQEAVFCFGVWSEALVRAYVVLVAVLVGVLSLGTAELSLSGRARTAWFAYVAVASAACAVVGGVTNVPASVLFQGIVWSGVPTNDVLVSSVLTFPSAALLIVSSAYGAVRARRPNLLFVTVGTGVIAAAGGLYLASFPAALLYAEFVGVVLLFLGFVRILDRPIVAPVSAAA
jgi:hypothetical protein